MAGRATMTADEAWLREAMRLQDVAVLAYGEWDGGNDIGPIDPHKDPSGENYRAMCVLKERMEETRTALESHLRLALQREGAEPTDQQIALAMLAVDDPLAWGRFGQGSDSMLRQFVRALWKVAAPPSADARDAARHARYEWLIDWLEKQSLLQVLFCQPPKQPVGHYWVLRTPATINGDSCEGFGKSEEEAIDAAMSAPTAAGAGEEPSRG